MEFGVRIGYNLGRLQFLSESSNSIVVYRKRNEILSDLSFMLGVDNINFSNNESFQVMASKILDYYRFKDIYKFSAIVLGISIVEVIVSNTQSQDIATQYITIAKNKIDLIPENILSSIQKEKLIKKALQIHDLSFDNCMELIKEIFLEYYDVHSTCYSDKYVFISYSSQEISSATVIRSLLENAGIHTWMAPYSIPSGSDYGECIPKAISSCNAFILILSEKSQKSKWVPKELDCAITNDKIVIPFHIDNSELRDEFYFRLTNVQRIDISSFQDFEAAYSSLIHRVKGILNI